MKKFFQIRNWRGDPALRFFVLLDHPTNIFMTQLHIDFGDSSQFRREKILDYIRITDFLVKRRLILKHYERIKWVLGAIPPETLVAGERACRAEVLLLVGHWEIIPITEMKIITRDPKNPRRKVQSDKAYDFYPQTLVQHLLDQFQYVAPIRPFSVDV